MNNITVHRQFTTQRNDILFPIGDGSKTIKDFLDAVGIEEIDYDYLHVYIGDIYVEKDMYTFVRPKSTTEVKIVMLPQGSDENFALIVMIGLAVVAGPAGLALAGGQAGWLATGYAIGITIAGSLIIGALFPPPEAPEIAEGTEGSPALTIAGSRNSFPYGKSVPRIYGTVKFFPPYAAQPYTLSEGGVQYLYMVFDFGYGPLELTDLKIGDTPIGDYTEVDVNIIEEVSSSQDLDYFTNDIDIENVNVNLEDGDPATIRTTSSEFNYAQFDLYFGGGLYAKGNEGNLLYEYVDFELVVKNESDIDVSSDFELRLNPLPPGVVSNVTDLDFHLWGVTEDGFSITYIVRAKPGITKPDFIKIELSRISSTEAGSVRVNSCSYTTLRTFKIGTCFNQFRLIDEIGMTYASHTMVEIKIKATDQLSGTLEKFNAIASSKLRKWNGTSFDAPAITDNPAWVYADILTGSMNQRAKDDSKINWGELKRWADFCDILAQGQNGISTKAHTCNFVLDYSSTIYKLLNEISAIGRGSPDIYDDMYSVIFDEPKTSKVQLFTNMNTSDFNSNRTYTEIPDAVKINFRDPESDWQMRELIVYNDGFDVSNAKVFEEINAPMLTNSNEAYRNGRYWLKQATLRKENISFKTDLEWLECKRGSLVGLQMDVIKSGGTVARIKTVVGQVVTVDTDPAMNGNDVLFFELRQSNGTIVSGPVAFYNLNDQYTVDLGISGASTGDMIVFNGFNQETYNLLVRKIDVNSDQTATLTCVEYAPELFDLASDPVPVYDPSINNVFYNPNNAPPILADLVIDEVINFVNKIPYVTLTLRYIPSLGSVPAYYRIYKQDLNTLEWIYQGTSTGLSFVWGDSILALEGPVIGAELRFSVVGVSDDGNHIDPSVGRQAFITPQGDTTIPEAPDYFVVEDTAENLRRFWWGYNETTEPEDLEGYVLRYTRSTRNPPEWGAATPLHDGVLINPPFEIRALPTGVQQVILRSQDTSKNLSDISNIITFNMGDRPVANVLFTRNFSDLNWPGFTVSGNPDTTTTPGILSADLTSSGNMWSATASTLMWTDDSELMWTTATDAFSWAENVTVPGTEGGITTIDWQGNGEVKVSYAEGVYPDDFLSRFSKTTDPTLNIEPYNIEDASFTNSNVTITPNYAISRRGYLEAFRLQDLRADWFSNISQQFSVSIGDYSWSFDIAKTIGSTVYPFVRFQGTGGATLLNNFYINLNTGETDAFQVIGLTSKQIIDNGDYWTVQITGTVTTQTLLSLQLFPAYASGTWLSQVDSNTLVDEITLWSWGVVKSATAWNPIGLLESTLYTGTGAGIIPYTSPMHLDSGDYAVLIESPKSIDINTITNMQWTTDVPDINEWFDDFAVADTGDTTITLTKPFTAITNVSITVQADGNNSRYCVVQSKSISAITVRCYNGGNSQVAGTIDVRVQGY
jgi:hypothetical protein